MVGGDPGCARSARCRPARRRGAAAPARVHAGRDRRRARPAARHCELAPPARTRPAGRRAGGGGVVRRSAFKRRLRDDLHAATPPRAAEAERRAWEVVRAAHSERDAVRRATGPRRLAVAALAAALAAVLVLSPAGAKVGDWIGEVVDPSPDATPSTLGSLPADGRLLVVGPGGPWVVRDDGARRRLGDFRDATWSPGGLFVAAGRGRELVALEPDGDEVWARPAPGRVDQPRWSPDGFRIAYRSGRDLWVAIGDNSGARLLARGVAAAPPAWQPGRPSPGQVLAFASGRRIRILEG